MPDAQRSGVYRTPTDVDAVRRADPRVRWVDLSLRGVDDKGRLMSALTQALGFRETFGGNWDALADALQDNACTGEHGCVLHITDSGMASLPETDRSTLLEVLAQTADYWRTHGKSFVVLIDAAATLPLWM